MSDVSITANSVALVSGNKTTVTANTTLTPGQVVTLDSGGRAVLSKNDVASNAAALGLTLCSAVTGQPIVVAQAGAQVTVGANNCVTKGGVYHVSVNAGGIAPEADFIAAQYVTQIGRSPNATDIVLEMNVYGYTHG